MNGVHWNPDFRPDKWRGDPQCAPDHLDDDIPGNPPTLPTRARSEEEIRAYMQGYRAGIKTALMIAGPILPADFVQRIEEHADILEKNAPDPLRPEA